MLTGAFPAATAAQPPATAAHAPAPRHLQAAPLRVFIVDDHTMFRRGVVAMLGESGDFVSVGEASSGDEAVRSAPCSAPDLVLVDMVMAGGRDGVATLMALRPLLPRARFVALSCRLDLHQVRRALAAGAACFVLKSASWQELVTVMHAARRGLCVHSPAVMDAMVAGERARAVGADLTARERALLALMARGLSNRDIGAAMGIAMPTVKFHVTNILGKLHADNRTAAVLTALRHQLVDRA